MAPQTDDVPGSGAPGAAARPAAEAAARVVEAAAGALGGGNVVARLSAVRLVGSAVGLVATRPAALTRAAGLAVRLGTVALGADPAGPPPRDARFADPTWRDNPAYRRLMQAYLACTEAAEGLLEDAEADDVDWRELERARFGVGILTSALAPPNVLPGNPEALKRAFETGGASVLRGLRNLADDVLHNGGAPLQVERGKYRVGRDLAATPGAVIARTDLYELVQYTPTTQTVHRIPLVIAPPVVNRHYFVDMMPGASLVEHMVAAGHTVLLPVWRNVRDGQGGHGLDDYAGALVDVLRIAADVAGSRQVNLFASCTAGTVALAAAALLEAEHDDLISSLALGVAMVGYDAPSAVGMIAGEDTIAELRRDAARGAVVQARDIEQGFGLLKPDQLVWSFARSRWLLGEEPLGTEVLAWSSAPTALASGLAADFAAISLHDAFRRPGTLTVRGVPVDLGALKMDAYVVAGKGDHISPWESCYAAVEELGGECRFILGAGGHLPTQVSPPGSPKAAYSTGPATAGGAQEWLRSAERVAGSWWDDYAVWLGERAGERDAAPASPGDGRPVLGPAPGRYAVE